MDDYGIEQSKLLKELGLTSLSSGLVFTCQIGGFPLGTFHVTDFNLTEGLSTLYTLNLNVVSCNRLILHIIILNADLQ